MKEKYVTPEMEIIEFESEDIITTSNPSTPEIDFFTDAMYGTGL